MSNVALYTFGLLDPAAGPTRMADFSRRAAEIYGASDHAPGFVARAEKAAPGSAAHTAGEDFGRWGPYALPLDLPDFAGHDPTIHIATLSLWRDADSARLFVYKGFHRDALKIRHDWFLKGAWPGHVLWRVADGAVPLWSDGVSRLQALARDGESAERFTFGSRWSRT